MEVFRRVDLGQFRLDERIDTEREPRVGGSGVLDYLEPGMSFTLRDLGFLMLAVSDNTASNALLDLVGMGEIQETIARMGLHHTKLARRLMDYAARDSGRDNVTSAGDMMHLLALVQRRALPGAPLLRELLLAQRVADDLLAWLPPGTPFACKTGTQEGTGHRDAVFSVAGLLSLPSGNAVALGILTAEQADPAAARIAVGRTLRAVWDAWGDH